jgi:D-alanyl-D-alanine dipeptidase
MKPGVPASLHARLPLVVLFLCAHCLLPFSVRAQSPALLAGASPPDAPAGWKGLLGEYSADKESATVLEKDGVLVIRFSSSPESTLHPAETCLHDCAMETRFLVMSGPGALEESAIFERAGNGFALSIFIRGTHLTRHLTASEGIIKFQIVPVRPIEELRAEALAASPPKETGHFRNLDLVEFEKLDHTIHLDIRYATSNDFLGTPVYSQSRAFLQRPAADALLRVQLKLKPLGYGLLIHDAYRPWYVTKIFWDATPPEGKIFVADPAQGSRHNRGCAVDLTLYDLATGKSIEMPGTYDEMSRRSFPDYPGGTSLQRWHRDLLRRAMESEGFTVYESEWWHFDYKDWKEYPILNLPFEKLGGREGKILLN